MLRWFRALYHCARYARNGTHAVRVLRDFGVDARWSFASAATQEALRGAHKRPLVLVNMNQESLIGSLAVQWALRDALQSEEKVPFIVNAAWLLHPFGWPNWHPPYYVIYKWLPPSWQQGRRVIERAARDLTAGVVSRVYMSIEGQRMRQSRTLHPYRKGAAWLACKSRALVVPVVMQNAFEAMPKGSWRVKEGACVGVRFEEPFDAAGLSVDEVMVRFKRVRVY